MKIPSYLLGLCLLFPSIAQAEGQAIDCGNPFDTPGRVGPWSYTDPFNWTQASLPGSRFKNRIDVVESRHFTQNVRSLYRGETNVEPIDDIGYTLDVIPDHHQALFSIIQLDKRTSGTLILNSKNKKITMSTPRALHAPCWFDRAVRFAPKDPKVWMLKGIYLHNNADYEKALQAYTKSESLFTNKATASSDLYYNMALTYLKLDDVDNAKLYAAKAYRAGYPLPGLSYLLDK